MKISLFSLDQEIHSAGIRILSSCLKLKGFDVQVIFLPPQKDPRDPDSKFNYTYSEKILRDLIPLCRDSKLIGISLMTNQFIPAVNLTQFLKTEIPEIPVIWGGIEPTVEPEECLVYADMVCLGEAEEALPELALNIKAEKGYANIKNIWYKEKELVQRSPIRPLLQDLNSLPLPDYSFENHYISSENGITHLTPDNFLDYQGRRFKSKSGEIDYPVISSRGCPFACSYCCNDVYSRLYPGQKRLRWRSTDHILAEIKMIEQSIAPIRTVFFVDDNFTARPLSKLKSFCQQYKDEIGVPFMCQVSPLTINEERIQVLLDAGCNNITMGVETANDQIAAMYNRSHMHKANERAIQLIEKYRGRLQRPPTYQFIINNPYESIEQILETLNFTLKLPRPWDNPIYSLMLFPGTQIYEKALKDGLIKDKYAQIYARDWHDHDRPYFQIWIRLYKAQFPVWILKILLFPPWVRFMTNKISTGILNLQILRKIWVKKR